MKGVFIGILITLINGSVFSATITSNGSGDWETGATWVGGVAPADGDDIIIAATHIVTIDGTGDISLNNVTISIFGTLLMDNDGADFANLTLTGTSGLAIEVGGAITEGVDDFTQEPFTNISLNGDVIWNACTGVLANFSFVF